MECVGFFRFGGWVNHSLLFANKLIMVAAFCAMTTSLAAALLETEQMDRAIESHRDGAIWVGGTPTLACIAGALGGSFFSICYELYRLRSRRMTKKTTPNEELDEFMKQRLALKFLMQPILSLVGTSPLIHYAGIPFTIEMILLVSFFIGSVGVWLINICAPWVENVLIPAVIQAFTRRAVVVINPPDISTPGEEPKPKPKRKRRAPKLKPA
jgi:hypothetical protein